MKKLLSIIMVLAIVFSFAVLAACNDSGGETSNPPGGVTAAGSNTGEPGEKVDLSQTKPGERIKEKLEAGMEVNVVFSTFSDNFYLQALGTGITMELEPLGFSVDCINGEDNVTTQISQLENCVQMSYSLIIIQCPDPSVVKDTIINAQNEGVLCLLYGEPADFTCVVRIDCYESAWQQSKMAAAWIDLVYPNQEVTVAVLATSANTANLEKKQAYLDYVEQHPNMKLGYLHEQCNSVDLGYTAAEEALTTFPDTRVFIDFDIGASIGVNNYLISQISTGLNIDEFGIFAAGEDNNTRTMLSSDYSEPTAFRGTILDGESMWSEIVYCALEVLYGNFVAPYEYLQPLYSINSFGYEYDSRNE